MKASWASSSIKAYETALSKWIKFCGQEKVDIIKPSNQQVVSWLKSIFDSGASFSSISSARSALITLLNLGGYNLSEDILIKKAMDAMERRRPKTPKYNQVWDPKPVLKKLSEWGDLEELNLKFEVAADFQFCAQALTS